MKKYAVLATLAFIGYMGLSNAFAQGKVFDLHTGANEGALVRIDLDEVRKGDSAEVVSKKHARAEKLLAAMVFGECRGQGEDCMLAVGHVAMNRARQDLDVRYGKGLVGVLKKHKAFSCFLKNDPNKKVIDRALAGKLKEDSEDGQAWETAQDVAHTLMHRETKDPTHGSTHYHTYAIHPAWEHDSNMKKVVKIDGHIFYKFG